jgi:acetyl-CoA carboxylase/biotin carboxylase 1
MANKPTMEEYVKAHDGIRCIKRILIANNGMAATKAIMSMRQWAFLELGSASVLHFVAMASKNDLDANMEFIRLADSFVEVPAGKNTFNYANVKLIVEIAKAQKVDAVWPGWGHASENPDLPRSLAEAGIMFLGPTAPVMHALGDKIASTILAQSSGVPCIPWNGEGITATIQSDGSIPQEPFKKACLQSLEEAQVHVKRIGYPVVLKASEGGGGKGIRKCTNDEELKLGWEQVTTEVAGSPVFMMQLCTGARHLEVQLVGDEHGQVVALIGRDCSTQRRFQKIFEEGPPTIAPKDDFREVAEKAAQRLAMSVGYRGAGTVEYLYKPETNGFYFLELNPRLQVEHPVTEGITGVNVPALQLQVGMGIPLHRCPDVRSFYGIDRDGSSKIDFLEDKYPYPECHVMAARVTAENPDDAFRPTSGAIERVRFQSAPNTWGYFSIGANGGIHEFADSQFGHIFSKGPTREDARRALQIALKQVAVKGEIRTATDYLVELADTKEFKENTIDTAWLDRLLAEKSVKTQFHLMDTVFYAACYRAFMHVKAGCEKALGALNRGHLPLQTDLGLIQSFVVETAYDNTKYVWQVCRLDEETFALTIGARTLEAKLREQPDGSLYIKCGNKVAQVVGKEEPLALRLRVEGGVTITFPRVRDPSELRSDFNGKVVRYLHSDGDTVQEGEAFVELEAMKMIMSLKSTATGKIFQSLSPGAIVSAGQLLATLELADPSKVQTVKTFSDEFKLSSEESQPKTLTRRETMRTELIEEGAEALGKILEASLRGYSLPPKYAELGEAAIVGDMFEKADLKLGQEISTTLLSIFLENERFFATLVGGDETQVKERFQGESNQLLALLLAHDKLQKTTQIVASVLRAVAATAEMDAALGPLPAEMTKSLQELDALPEKGGYLEVKVLARQVLEQSKAKPFDEKKAMLRQLLTSTARKDLFELANSSETSGESYLGLDLMASMLCDEDPSIRHKAAEVYLRRLYRGFDIIEVEQVESKDVVEKSQGAVLHLLVSYKHLGVSTKVHKDYAVVVPDIQSLEKLASAWAMPALPEFKKVHVLVAKSVDSDNAKRAASAASTAAAGSQIASVSDFVTKIGSLVDAKKCARINVMIAREGKRPSYLHYHAEQGWREVPQYRNTRSTFPFLTELHGVQEEYSLEALKVSRVYATFHGKKLDTKTALVHICGLSHKAIGLDTFENTVQNDLGFSFENIEQAVNTPALDGSYPGSRVFVHYVSPIAHCTERDISFLRVLFADVVQKSVASHSTRINQCRVEEMSLKVWVPPAQAGGSSTAVRLVASSISGWQVTAFRETIDEDSGYPSVWTNVETGETTQPGKVTAKSMEDKLGLKRAVARRADSTYIYDFPLLFRTALVKSWLQASQKCPEDSFTCTELVLEGGKMVTKERPAGENSVGMVAFLCKMKTPEYPQGREMMLIGNDMTIKAGSFGTVEDDVFYHASKMARAKGIPRVYVACNSGARLGTVEELKSKVQVAWVDPNDLNKGFEYLYLTDADMNTLPPDSVRSHPMTVAGQTRHVLDAILGLNLPSTKGGIGVENLQGSGLIAGETSRAYEQTFTLSYVSGRSVGIGAYLNRLGQRNIQMVKGPMILTGFQALNKLLGQQVYTTQDQLGGPHIMVPNGVTHELVRNDQDGVEAILRWMSYIPSDVLSVPPIISTNDPIERAVAWIPGKTPYDPRLMLTGETIDGQWVPGFCDAGSFNEYMPGWGKTVIVGRGRLGGMPVGIVAVETRAVERHIPADPAARDSQDIKEPQAGQVWYPDSAYKTATAIRDFNRGENLPLIIFANWRGFSGGTRDMFAEVLKYGAMIVDALVDYKHPITIYIPPNGELRGGAWVVLDPKINPDQMEMFADVEARGGILEPPAASEIVFKQDKHVIEMMHRLDDKLRQLDADLKGGKDVSKEIKAREKLLLPMYKQVSVTYCDLHDRSGRMKGLGAIREELKWSESRAYLHWRIRRRLQENGAAKKLQEGVGDLPYADAAAVVRSMVADVESGGDRVVAQWIESNSISIAAKVESERQRLTSDRIFKMFSSLPAAARADVVRDLVGYTKVLEASSK